MDGFIYFQGSGQNHGNSFRAQQATRRWVEKGRGRFPVRRAIWGARAQALIPLPRIPLLVRESLRGDGRTTPLNDPLDATAVGDVEGDWLLALVPWALSLVRLLGVRADQRQAIVEHAVALAVARWDELQPKVDAVREGPPALSGATVRLHWLLRLLFQSAGAALAEERERERPFDPFAETSSESVQRLAFVHRKVFLEPADKVGNALRWFERCTTPERWRAWVLCEVEGYSVAEAAAVEGVAVSTLQARLSAFHKGFARQVTLQTTFRKHRRL